ncbi:MAG: hypothetical protein M3Z96_03620 [Pseudomonadota bacterium]|nr:hypothetical protein [Pseudomonadota bacterium]
MTKAGFLREEEREGLRITLAATGAASLGVVPWQCNRAAERWVKLRRGRSGAAGGRRLDSLLVQTSTRNTGWPGSRSPVMATATAICHRARKQNSWNGYEPKRSRRASMISAWIKETHGVEWGHAGRIALSHRLGLEHRKPEAAPRDLDVARHFNRTLLQAVTRLRVGPES